MLSILLATTLVSTPSFASDDTCIVEVTVEEFGVDLCGGELGQHAITISATSVGCEAPLRAGELSFTYDTYTAEEIVNVAHFVSYQGDMERHTAETPQVADYQWEVYSRPIRSILPDETIEVEIYFDLDFSEESELMLGMNFEDWSFWTIEGEEASVDLGLTSHTMRVEYCD